MRAFGSGGVEAGGAVAIEGHNGQRWRISQLLARLKINALLCVKTPGTDLTEGERRAIKAV